MDHIRNLRCQTLIALAVTFLVLASPVSAAPPVDLDSYKGKVVVLDFWASWCVPCRRSFPWLDDMQAKYEADGLVIIGVNLDNDADEAVQFLEEFRPKFKIVYDLEKELAREYDVIAMPSSYVIGRDGALHKRHLGFKVKRQSEYEAEIISALNAKEPAND
jgi:cytochrome c biogenesis protein CcmG/thiol:disulfide interchange protein DsbE